MIGKDGYCLNFYLAGVGFLRMEFTGVSGQLLILVEMV